MLKLCLVRAVCARMLGGGGRPPNTKLSACTPGGIVARTPMPCQARQRRGPHEMGLRASCVWEGNRVCLRTLCGGRGAVHRVIMAPGDVGAHGRRGAGGGV